MQINYRISAEAYLVRAMKNVALYMKEENVNFAFYAALELRNAIERTLFEYLALFKEGGLSKKDVKEYRPKELILKIDEIEPEFEYKLKFIEACLNAITDKQYNIEIPDMKKLNRLYGELGNYLHAPKEPAKTSEKYEWYERLTILLLETKEYLVQLLSNHRASISSVDDELLEVYEEFKTTYPKSKEIHEKLKLLLTPKES